MNTHLSPEDFVDALDGALDPRRCAHLDSCQAWRLDLEAVQAAMGAVRDVAAPEPSPLFWDHFSARVKQATAEVSVPGRAWWNLDWRPIGAMAAAVGALALVMILRPGSGPAELSRGGGLLRVGQSAPAEDGTWGLVVGLAAELELSDVEQAAAPADGTADAVIADLTPAQRDALARLLQQEIGDW